MVKFGHVVFETRELTDQQTDRQTYRHTDTLQSQSMSTSHRYGGEVN